MMAKIAGVALATMVGVCALAGGAKAAIINYGGQGTYDGDNYYFDTFNYDTYTGKGTAYVSYGYPPGEGFSLVETSNNVISATITQDNLNLFHPMDGQSLNFGIEFQSDVSGNIPDGNGGSKSVQATEPLYFAVTIFAIADGNGRVSLFSQGGFGGYYNGDDSPSSVSISPVPIPRASGLLGLALLALGGIGYLRSSQSKRTA